MESKINELKIEKVTTQSIVFDGDVKNLYSLYK